VGSRLSTDVLHCCTHDLQLAPDQQNHGIHLYFSLCFSLQCMMVVMAAPTVAALVAALVRHMRWWHKAMHRKLSGASGHAVWGPCLLTSSAAMASAQPSAKPSLKPPMW
jgi:hypothetical protein